MSINLPEIIHKYIEASNAHDVRAILACFSENAVVQDEQETHREKEAIGNWIRRTIDKYNFQFKPRSLRTEHAETVVTVEVSGTFDGSPITLDYRFITEKGKITSLKIG